MNSTKQIAGLAIERRGSQRLGHRLRAVVVMVALLGFAWRLGSDLAEPVGATVWTPQDSIPNNHPAQNPGGKAATFSTQGSVDLTGEYFQAQGTNGRSCASCHIPEEAWSINPGTLQHLFDETDGTHPVFNLLDANNPNMDVSTPEARLAAYSMLLSRGVFRRGGAPRPNSEWELIAVDDPHGFANLTRLVHWRRAMPTINFAARERDGQLGRRQQRRRRPARRAGQSGHPQRDGRSAGPAGPP